MNDADLERMARERLEQMGFRKPLLPTLGLADLMDDYRRVREEAVRECMRLTEMMSDDKLRDGWDQGWEDALRTVGRSLRALLPSPSSPPAPEDTSTATGPKPCTHYFGPDVIGGPCISCGAVLPDILSRKPPAQINR